MGVFFVRLSTFQKVSHVENKSTNKFNIGNQAWPQRLPNWSAFNAKGCSVMNDGNGTMNDGEDDDDDEYQGYGDGDDDGR